MSTQSLSLSYLRVAYLCKLKGRRVLRWSQIRRQQKVWAFPAHIFPIWWVLQWFCTTIPGDINFLEDLKMDWRQGKRNRRRRKRERKQDKSGKRQGNRVRRRRKREKKQDKSEKRRGNKVRRQRKRKRKQDKSGKRRGNRLRKLGRVTGEPQQHGYQQQ
jgi:hypothetical protein